MNIIIIISQDFRYCCCCRAALVAFCYGVGTVRGTEAQAIDDRSFPLPLLTDHCDVTQTIFSRE